MKQENFDFIISDWHMGETRLSIMQRLFSSPLDMFLDIRRRHNAIVTPDDRVLFVGDAVSKAAEDPHYWLEKISTINGKKTIIRGNHDTQFTDEELLKVFDEVVPEGLGIEFDIVEKNETISCFATHYPTRGRVDRFNLVGHIHSAWKVQKNMLNVCCDVHSFTPIHLSKIPFFLKAISDFYDDDVWVAENPINALWDSRGKKSSYFVEQRISDDRK